MVAYIAEPDLCRAGTDYCGISGSVCAAFNSIEPDPRNIETLQAPVVEECQTDNGRRLPKQAQRLGPPLLVGLVAPGQLNQPAELVCDTVDEVMDFGCGSRRLNAKQLIKPCLLVAIAEPRFDNTVDRERNGDRHEQYQQVLSEKAAKTLSDNHFASTQ